MKTLVTGAAGFIGSNLADTLLKLGHEVTGIDCFTEYYDRSIKEKNIENAKKNENFTFLEEDLKTFNLKEILGNFDAVFHEAAQPGVRYSWDHFNTYLDNNILVTQRILDANKDSKTKIIFASSSSVYGDAELPMKEDSVLKPVSPYGLTKLACENLLYSYSKNYGIPATALRYFTVFGERQRPDMAICNFFNKILNGEEIQIYGDGTQTRDFTYVQDIVDATIKASELDTNFEIINVGGGSKISVNELVELMGKVAGKEAKISNIENSPGDITHTYADISKAKSLLNYEPKTSVEIGLKKYFEWLK